MSTKLRLSPPAKALCVIALSMALLATPFVGMAAEIKDVPKDHWAYQAVKALVDKGYLALYGDGTFQGAKSVDRYTLAVVIAKILSEIQTGKVGSTPEDVELLRQLSAEFREELVQVARDLGIFKKALDEQARSQVVMKEDLARLTHAQSQMRSEVDEMIADIAASTADNIAAADRRAREAEEGLAARIGETAQEISRVAGDLAQGLGSAEASMESLGRRMSEADMSLSGRLDAHDGKIAQLDEDLSAAILRLSTLEPQVALVTDGLVTAKRDIEKSIDALDMDLGATRQDLAATKGDLVALQGEVGALQAQLGMSVTELNTADSQLQQALEETLGKTLKLDEGLAAERASRVSADASLQTALTGLAGDFAAYKAQTAKDVEALRKENGLLKALLAAVAVLGLVIK